MSRIPGILRAHIDDLTTEADRLGRNASTTLSYVEREALSDAAEYRRQQAEGVRQSLEIVQAELRREREEAILMTARALGWSLQETRELFDRQSPAPATLSDAAQSGP